MKEVKESKKELVGRLAWTTNDCLDLDESSPFRDAMFSGIIVGYEYGKDREGKERITYTLRNAMGNERTVPKKRLFFSEEEAFTALATRVLDEVLAAAKYLLDGDRAEINAGRFIVFDAKRKRFCNKCELKEFLAE